MPRKSFAVIGLGQFGRSIVKELIANGDDVIAIDNNEATAKQIGLILPTTFVADSTDENALKELGIADVDSAIVAFGDNQEASVLTTVILRELGLKNIIVRVDDDYYVPIMKKLGATEVITPQKAAGSALANRLGNKDFHDYYKIDNKYSVVSIAVNPGFFPTTLKQMNANRVYGINLVIIKRGSKSFAPSGQDSLLPDDIVYIVGTQKQIAAFRNYVNGRSNSKKQ